MAGDLSRTDLPVLARAMGGSGESEGGIYHADCPGLAHVTNDSRSNRALRLSWNEAEGLAVSCVEGCSREQIETGVLENEKIEALWIEVRRYGDDLRGLCGWSNEGSAFERATERIEKILLPYVAEWMRENPRVEHVLTKCEWREYHKHRSCTLDQHRACRFLNLVIGAAKESLKKKSKG
jgi:hypothetical protein